jgi:hypothetical protein
MACIGNNLAAEVQFDKLALIPEKSRQENHKKTLNLQPLTTPNQSGRNSMSENMISAEIQPLPSQAQQAAKALQNLGFRILHIGPTISVQAPRQLWESTFNVSFVPHRKTVMPEIERGEVAYQRAVTENLRIPVQLQNVIAEVMFVEPPEFY